MIIEHCRERQDFYSHSSAERKLFGLVDYSHTATTHFPDNAKVTKGSQRRDMLASHARCSSRLVDLMQEIDTFQALRELVSQMGVIVEKRLPARLASSFPAFRGNRSLHGQAQPQRQYRDDYVARCYRHRRIESSFQLFSFGDVSSFLSLWTARTHSFLVASVLRPICLAITLKPRCSKFRSSTTSR